jgi:hypothetical protein
MNRSRMGKAPDKLPGFARGINRAWGPALETINMIRMGVRNHDRFGVPVIYVRKPNGPTVDNHAAAAITDGKRRVLEVLGRPGLALTKVGTGFTDAELRGLPRKLAPYRRARKHRLVETGIEADVWFDPAVVTEVQGAQLTVSPVHTVARQRTKKGGLALRFPRFVHWREDKAPEQATTVNEIYDLCLRLSRSGDRSRQTRSSA